MTDIVSVPTGNFTPGARATLEFPAALINAAWNQANAKFELFEYKMGLVTNAGGTGWLDDAAVPVISAPSVAFTNPTSTNSISATSEFEAANVATPALTTATAATPALTTATAATPALTTATAAAPALTTATAAAPALTTATAATPALTTAVISTPTDPGVTVPTDITESSVIATFTSEQQDLWDQLVAGFVGFRTSYFPNENTLYATAETWLQDALDNAHGLPSAVAAQVLTDSSDRISVELSRATDSITARFAASRFPLPSGALASAILQLQQKAQDDIADASRKLVIASIEQLRFVVDKVLSLRQSAMAAALDYCRTLASATPGAVQLTEAAYDAQVKLINSAAAYYGARISASEAVAKVSQFNVGTSVQIADLTTRNEQFNVDASVKIADATTKNAQFNVEESIKIADLTTRNEQFNVDTAVKIADMTTRNAQFNVDASIKVADIDNRNSQFNVDTAVKIADMTTKNSQFNASATMNAAERNQQADLTVRDARLKALLGELHSLAQMATALFNNLHVSSQTSYTVNGTDST